MYNDTSNSSVTDKRLLIDWLNKSIYHKQNFQVEIKHIGPRSYFPLKAHELSLLCTLKQSNQ